MAGACSGARGPVRWRTARNEQARRHPRGTHGAATIRPRARRGSAAAGLRGRCRTGGVAARAGRGVPRARWRHRPHPLRDRGRARGPQPARPRPPAGTGRRGHLRAGAPRARVARLVRGGPRGAERPPAAQPRGRRAAGGDAVLPRGAPRKVLTRQAYPWGQAIVTMVPAVGPIAGQRFGTSCRLMWSGSCPHGEVSPPSVVTDHRRPSTPLRLTPGARMTTPKDRLPADQESTAADAPHSPGRRPSSRPRRGLGSRIARTVGWIAGGLVGLLLVAVGVTAVLDAVDRRQVQPPGELVELADGRRLHLHLVVPDGAQDTAVDAPTVVLEAGAGGTAATYAWLQAELAEEVTVVAYDRAGYGFSEASDRPVGTASVVADLSEGLDLVGVDGPIVLVGHSLGAGYARMFAAAHPDRVAGLVLLDPVHEEQLEQLGAEERASLAEAQEQLAIAPVLARLGVFRLSNPQAQVVASLPTDAGEQHRARSVTAAGMRTYGAEMQALPDLLDEIGRAEDPTAEPFAGVPTRVVSAGASEEGASPDSRAVMESLHRELADRSPLASHTVLDRADHLSLLVDPEHAREVATVVVDLLDETAAS
ncbi:MAG: alpha/beta fold hydrolase [Nitriliruptor sp.]|nr:MAG: alpha/beta fold hydrolase [Nitriliruptor sp.]